MTFSADFFAMPLIIHLYPIANLLCVIAKTFSPQKIPVSITSYNHPHTSRKFSPSSRNPTVSSRSTTVFL